MDITKPWGNNQNYYIKLHKNSFGKTFYHVCLILTPLLCHVPAVVLSLYYTVTLFSFIKLMEFTDHPAETFVHDRSTSAINMLDRN